MTFRKSLFWLHLVTGVAAGAVILVMSVTGILLAFEKQAIGFAERGYRATAEEQARPRLGLDALLAKAREAAPGEMPGSVSVRSEAAAPVGIGFGREKTLFFNPYTGALVGHGSSLRGFFHEVTLWHRWLGSREIGKPVADICNIAFAGLAISGLILWCPRRWPWRWNRAVLRPIAWINTGLRGKAREWNWHNAIGLWCAPVLLVLTLTGVVMSYPWANNLVYSLTGSEAPPPRGRPGRPGGGHRGFRGQGQAHAHAHAGEVRLAKIDPLFAAAVRKVPQWRSISLQIPQPGSKEVTLSLEETSSPHPYARSSLTLDPRTAAVVKWEPFREQNAGRKARSWIRAAHTGEAGGLAGQIVAALACAGGALLVWSGYSLALRRFAGRKRRRARSETAFAPETERA